MSNTKSLPQILNISKSLLSVTNRKELLKTIFEVVRPIFSFDNAGLFIIDTEKDIHYEILNEIEILGEDDNTQKKVIEENLLGPFKHKGTGVAFLSQKTPTLFDLKEDGDQWPHPQIPLMLDSGLKQLIGIGLYKEEKLFGMFCFNSKQKDFYTSKHFELFTAIAEQISIVTSNLLDKEEIISKRNENELLLSIASKVSEIRTLPKFLKFVIENVQPIFYFHDVGIFILTDDKKYHYDLAAVHSDISPSDWNSTLKETGITLVKHKDSVVDYMMQQPSGEHQVALLDFKNLTALYPDYYQVEAFDLNEAGYRDCLVSRLEVHGEVLGMFCINALQKNFFSPSQFGLFKSISQQLSIAISNILANERVLKREKEKEQLLNITQRVNEIRNISELLQFVMGELKEVFKFHDAGVFLLTDDKKLHYDIAGIDPWISESAWNTGILNTNITQVIHKGSLIEWMMEMVTKNDGIELFDFQDLSNRFPDYYQFQIPEFKEANYRDCLTANLKVGDITFGMLCINALEKDFFKASQFRFFQSAVNQISIALYNIISDEKLLAEKKLTEELFKLSNVTSNIQNRLELVKAFLDSIKHIFPFDDLGLFIIDWEKDEHQEILAHIDYGLEDDPIADVLVEGNLVAKLKHSDSAVDYIVQQGTPVIFNLEKDGKKYPHPQIPIMLEYGFKEIIGTALKNGEEIIGMLCFNSYEEGFYSQKNFPILQTIADQIAVVMSSIIANENLKNEKIFSDTLLKISEAISKAKSTKEIYNKISTEIKPILPFDRLGLLLVNETGDLHYELMEGYSATSTFPEIINSHTFYEHKGTSVEYFMEKGPVIIDMEKLDKITSHPQHGKMFKAKLKCLMGAPLIANGKKFGMICFKSQTENFYNSSHIPLFKSIAEQVSVGLSNILAKERIQFQNQQQALEIQLSKIATQELEWKDKVKQILQAIQVLVPFNHAMIFSSYQKDKALHFEQLGKNENRLLTSKELSIIYKIEEKKVKKLEKDLSTFDGGESIIIQDLSKSKLDIHKRLIQYFSFQSLLCFDISLPDDFGKLTILMLDKKVNQFREENLEVLKNISNTLELSLTKSFTLTKIKNLSEQLSLEKEYLQDVVKEAYNFHDLIGESESMKNVFAKITEVADVDANVLIAGETGTGKELIARAIHEYSHRKNRVLVKVNCAAVPAQIVESELFGHERGAFTGAFQRRIGKFELAHEGTIFLDEIGEMPLELQAKLLRVLQEKEIERLGSNKVIPLDFRVIAATNRNLEEEIKKGKFRADLFFRLNTFPIIVPPLRNRAEDILLLANFTARKFSTKLGVPFKGFSPNSIRRLQAYDYPGNVRELQNIIEQSVISQKGKTLEIFPRQDSFSTYENGSLTKTQSSLIPVEELDMDIIKRERDDLERRYLLKVLENKKWKVSGKNGAANKLGVAASTLESRMKKLGISRD